MCEIFVPITSSRAAINAGEPLTVTFTVKNIGDCDGEEVAEAYLISENVFGAPRLSLVGFQMVLIPKGASKTVQLVINPRQLSYVSPRGARAVRSGEYKLFVGGGQPSTTSGRYLPFRITGTVPLPR